METKLFKTELASYVPATWNGKNESGWTPIGDRVIILPDQAAEIIRGVHIPDEVKGRHALAAEAGCLIAAGEGAFKWNSDRVTPFEGRRPLPGERVNIHRYSGQTLMGKDGVLYRVLDSQEVGAVAEATPVVVSVPKVKSK